jgi:hypothetical protein
MPNLDATTSEKLLPIAKHIVESCTDLAGAIKFDKEHPQHLYTICTYGTILEIATGIIALVDARQVTCVPILLRTLLDALASFRCCIVDPNHFKAMYASFTKEKRRLLGSVMKNADNPYLKELSKTIDVAVAIPELEKELAALKAQGYEPLSAFEEFKKAGLQAEFQSLYWQLCMHAHNNVSALEDRHIERTGESYEVVFFKEEDAADLIRYLDAMCGIVLEATKRLHEILTTGENAKINAIGASLAEIRAHYA